MCTWSVWYFQYFQISNTKHEIMVESVGFNFPKFQNWIFVPGMMVLKLTDFVILPAKILQLFSNG